MNDIANLFASKLNSRLNTHPGISANAFHSFDSSLFASQLSEVNVSVEDVLSVLESLKPGKTDSDRVSSNHLKFALPVIAESVASFFTAILRHGYMPKSFRDCVVIPIPKSCNDLASSENYRPISLASCFSKALERIILDQYSSFFFSHPLQFGFKCGSSTSLCTGIVKCVVSKYLQNGSSVLGCFLDASKAFDMVDHCKLFSILNKRGLPSPIIRFLSSWYQKQEMKVQWGSSLSNGFSVSNGVRQGGVLSPYLFAVYLDGLLEELSNSGVGCYWGSSFVGALAYADDVVLLAPCASALRCMLSICSSFASHHGLVFNAKKTQLICFRTFKSNCILPTICFENVTLKYTDEIKHLGHILNYNLDDGPDIIRALKDLNKKANSVLCTFCSADPVVKTYLIKMYCLSLYGYHLWSLSSKSLNALQIALNKILRKVWNLLSHSHSSIVHCTAIIPAIHNTVFRRFNQFLSRSVLSHVPIVSSIIHQSSLLAHNFLGYNNFYGSIHLKHYSSVDLDISLFIRSVRLKYRFPSPYENHIHELSCS